MAQIPVWLIGKNVSSVTARIETVGADGTLTLATPNLTTTGVVDEIDYNGRQTTENVVALTSIRENTVPVEVDDQFVLTEILQAGSGSRNFLSQLWNNTAATPASPYVRLSITRGNNTWAGDFLMSEYVESFRKGKSTGRMTLLMQDIGNANANPAYS